MNQKKFRLINMVGSLGILIGSLSSTHVALANTNDDNADLIKQGKEIVFDRRRGNCLACHMIPSANIPGNVAPPLVAMKQRFPDKARLRRQIWDAMEINPETSMPPFGKYQILTESEIDKVVEYIHSL